jgi:hypothetical protein
VARELAEMTYEFDQPFVLDTSKYKLVALVRAGAKFEKGVLVERPDEAEPKIAA